MKITIHTLKQQTQDFLLRLFVEPESGLRSAPSDYCTCAHVGTFSRLHG